MKTARTGGRGPGRRGDGRGHPGQPHHRLPGQGGDPGVLGFGIVNDAYTIANTLPNIIFELLIGGVLTSVAIPLLSRARADPDGGEGYTQRLMTMAFVGLIGATGLAVAAAPLLTRLYLSGSDSWSTTAWPPRWPTCCCRRSSSTGSPRCSARS